MTVKYLSVCSGIEAATVAWEPLGWEPIAFSEIEPFPSAVLKARWPEVPNLGDFIKITPDMLTNTPDVIVGGTPCQAFSVAGLRNSLEDDRGNLTLGFVHLVDRLNPSVVLWENVPGALSTKDNAFGWFLAGLVGADDQLFPSGKRGKWTNAGLVHGPKRRVAWRVLDAQYFGVAQRRKRLFVVACPVDGADPAAILLELKGDRRDTPPSREARQGAAETARLDSLLRDMVGETVLESSPVLCGDGTRPAEVAATLRHENGSPGYANQDIFSQGGTNLVPQIMASGQSNSEFGNDLCTTQSARQYKDPPILTQVFRKSKRAQSAQDDVTWVPAEVANTLNCFDDGGDARATHLVPEVSDPITTREGKTYTQEGKNFRTRNLLGDCVRMVVRRLLPVECARLQGFPDDHARIPWGNKPAEDCPDGHQYKCYGNSMAVPVIAWLGARIEAVLTGKPFVYGIPESYRLEIESRSSEGSVSATAIRNDETIKVSEGLFHTLRIGGDGGCVDYVAHESL